MKISDLLGEGWESDEGSEATAEPRPTSPAPTAPAPTAPAEAPSPDAGLPPAGQPVSSWAPPAEPSAPEPSAPPVSARAQLADLAAGLAAASGAPIEPRPDALDAPDELASLAGSVSLVEAVDDLLPDATQRAKGSSRATSRSGSRRRGR